MTAPGCVRTLAQAGEGRLQRAKAAPRLASRSREAPRKTLAVVKFLQRLLLFLPNFLFEFMERYEEFQGLAAHIGNRGKCPGGAIL